MDYKDSVFLPKTSFAMRGNLTKLEQNMLKRWADMDLTTNVGRKLKSKGKFILHDGPPYANGHLHIGHAFNKILKDVIVRSRNLMGYATSFVPGWDCHGLPIEWKVEEKYRKAGKKKDDVPVEEFRSQCRDFAKKWVDVHIQESKRLGCTGLWHKPYLTMDKKSESVIADQVSKFLLSGQLYRGFKPVMWSVVEKTALAEAEVEYHNHTSNSIYVAFPIVETKLEALQGAFCVIWTTTPWTIPANRAIAYGQDIDYSLITVKSVSLDGLVKVGAKLLIATDLLENFCKNTYIDSHDVVTQIKGKQLQGSICRHPLYNIGYDSFDVPLLPADHVTTESGTGLVHTAPSHGLEDFLVGKQFNLEVPDTVDDGGVYNPQIPVFAGIHIFKADDIVIERLRDSGNLLATSKLEHSYPHSWRSKAPLIYRAVPQWFIAMDDGLRSSALAALDNVTFIPEAGKNRIRSMVESRPDWCLSRQRVWGVPIPVFLNKNTKQVLKDESVAMRIVKAFEVHGCDVWFNQDPRQFLADDYNHDDYEPVYDIVDVWFESGVTHEFVLKARPELDWPADLYLEGSDQHRGWFQSSLLASCGTNGRAPYKAVMTHGFVLDKNGHKMSKSLGNVISPLDVCDKMGAEILRLWVVNSDYSMDIRVSQEILRSSQDIYRRLRNTLRYLLGAIGSNGKSAFEQNIDYNQLPLMEKWILAKLYDLNESLMRSIEDYELQNAYSKIHDFCNNDLSAYYFDIRKDSLYCDGKDSVQRKQISFVFATIFEYLVRWVAPVLPFTAEEAWLHYVSSNNHPDNNMDASNDIMNNLDNSIHLQEFLNPPAQWQNNELLVKFVQIRKVRSVITTALEKARQTGEIGSSLQAKLVISDPKSLLDTTIDWCEQTIVSKVIIDNKLATDSDNDSDSDAYTDVQVNVEIADVKKCQRCWRHDESVGSSKSYDDLCQRCEGVVSALVK